MNQYIALIVLIVAALIMYIFPLIFELNSKEDLGVLELDIHRAEPGKKNTILVFQDIDLPSGYHIEDLDISIPNATYSEMRKAKQFRVNIHFERGRRFIKGKFHSLISV